jgi:class 3 adenylate cyclase
VEPNRRDLPQLAAVLRRVPAAILAVPRLPHAELMRRLVARHTGGPAVPKPEDRVLRQGLKGLVSAASVSIDAGTEWFGTTRVPAIRLADSPRAGGLLEDEPAHLSPGALVLLAAARGHNNLPLTPWSGGVTVAGARIPAIAPDLALVDYGGPLRAEGLPSVAYSTVLGGGTIYTAEPVDEGNEMTVPKVRRWSPAEYFKGRIVVLEALGEEERETPVGRLGTSALLAHAAATLISGEIVRPVPPVLAVLGVLAAGLLVGASCAGVAPLAAGWRFALILLGPLLAAPVLIVLGTWLDPVTPLFAAVMSFALVTQITYRHELDERQRERDLLARVAAPEVVDELLSRTGQIALGGARRRVCILFADVRGFTPFAESRSAEEVITVINRYTTAMTDALLSHGGILDRYTGDGLISRFEVLGLPEHDVCRAVEAALAIRDASEAVAARLTAEGEGALHVGIGVHYGEAVVGLVGSPAQFHYTAMGHTVVVAARLQGIAAGGEVLITEEVYELTANAFRCEPREPVAVKGISEPIRTYKVLDAQPGT